jgi:conjugative relaxase-like TrwC/TraI family protein
MLSIAKIKSAAGSAAHYYTEEIRVEDYYVKGQDTPGQWRGGEALGLDQKVSLEQLQRLMAGEHPETGERLIGRGGTGRDRNPGWDLTFSAPKSVSALYAAGDDKLKEGIKQAHHNAVAKAMGYLEADCLDNAARVVSKKGGRRVESTAAVKGLVWGEFFHRTSRELDAQIHSHCVVPNVAQREDGKWIAPNLQQVFREKMTAGAIYRAELGQGMRALGFEIEADRQFFRVKEVPKELETEMSKRRQEIEARMMREGVEGAKQASRVTLLTRKEKRLVDEKHLHAAWQSVAAEKGLTPERLAEIRQPGASLSFDQATRQDLVRNTLKELSQGVSTFTAEQARAKLAEKAQTVMTADQIRETFKDLFRSGDLVKLSPDREGRMRYTTKELREVEERILNTSKTLSRTQDMGISKEAIEQRLRSFEAAQSQAKGTTIKLGQDQREAAMHALGPGRIKVVAGVAGAGKTFSMEAVARALEADGYRVSGMAPSGIAASKLADAKIPTQTVDLYLLRRAKGITPALTDKDVVILDEAGMIGSRKMDRILSEVEKTGAKVILLGEAEQLQPIEAGGIFKAISDEIGKAGLTTIVRQEEKWQRDAVMHFRAGEAEQGLKLFQDRGKLSIHENGQDMIKGMVSEQVRLMTMPSEKPVSVVSISKTNSVVDQLNHGVREELKAKGVLPRQGVEIEVKYGHYAERQKMELVPGDKIVFLRNDRKLDVQNGLFAEVKGFERDIKGNLTGVLFKDERGKDHTIDVSKYPHLRHSYAITGYKSQGSTFTHTVVHATPEMSREETYVKMSRQKVDAKLFVSKDAWDVKYSELSPAYRDQPKQKAQTEAQEQKGQFLSQKAQEKAPEQTASQVKSQDKTLEQKMADALGRSQSKDVSTSYKVAEPQIHRTEQLEKIAQELPNLKGEKRIQALAEVATSLGGVANKYESPSLNPPWQDKAREILDKGSFEKIPELAKDILSHPKGKPSLQTEKEIGRVQELKAGLKPILDKAISLDKSLSISKGKGIER